MHNNFVVLRLPREHYFQLLWSSYHDKFHYENPLTGDQHPKRAGSNTIFAWIAAGTSGGKWLHTLLSHPSIHELQGFPSLRYVVKQRTTSKTGHHALFSRTSVEKIFDFFKQPAYCAMITKPFEVILVKCIHI